MAEDLSFDQLVALLERHRVRATYGAVAGYLHKTAMFLMTEFPREQKYSWVVSKETHEPTDYTEDQIHPDLRQHSMVIADEAELRDWLKRKADQAARKRG